jgi:hypothetical protein
MAWPRREQLVTQKWALQLASLGFEDLIERYFKITKGFSERVLLDTTAPGWPTFN